MKKHVTIQEVAQVLGCSTKTVKRKVDRGLIPAIQPGGKGPPLSFDLDDVIRAVKSATLNSIPDSASSRTSNQPNPTERKLRGPKPKWKQELDRRRQNE